MRNVYNKVFFWLMDVFFKREMISRLFFVLKNLLLYYDINFDYDLIVNCSVDCNIY